MAACALPTSLSLFYSSTTMTHTHAAFHTTHTHLPQCTPPTYLLCTHTPAAYLHCICLQLPCATHTFHTHTPLHTFATTYHFFLLHFFILPACHTCMPHTLPIALHALHAPFTHLCLHALLHYTLPLLQQPLLPAHLGLCLPPRTHCMCLHAHILWLFCLGFGSFWNRRTDRQTDFGFRSFIGIHWALALAFPSSLPSPFLLPYTHSPWSVFMHHQSIFIPLYALYALVCHWYPLSSNRLHNLSISGGIIQASIQCQWAGRLATSTGTQATAINLTLIDYDWTSDLGNFKFILFHFHFW